MTQVLAVDWSGRATGAAEAIWLAVVRDGRLVDLDNGRERDEVIRTVVALADQERRTVVGLDFAFGFPAWYAQRNGWTTGRAVWDAMRERGENLLRMCPPPFWGRPGTREQRLGEPLRRTEQRITGRPKSVFQIGGAGAVGTGSLRGMPHLADLSDAGVAIWPFDEPGWPLAVEIYPRLLTGPVVKTRHRARREHLAAHFVDQPVGLIERAAGSEDAFDAAVSALVMARHLDRLAALPRLDATDPARLEGAIWAPPACGGAGPG